MAGHGAGSSTDCLVAASFTRIRNEKKNPPTQGGQKLVGTINYYLWAKVAARKDKSAHNSGEFQHKHLGQVKNYDDNGVVRISPCPLLNPVGCYFLVCIISLPVVG